MLSFALHRGASLAVIAKLRLCGGTHLAATAHIWD
jgi:hypothetical protein